MDPLLIVLFIVLFLLSAFFSGTELALMSLAPHKLEAIFKEGKYGSKALQKIKENNDRLLITILIWNNLVNTFTAALATSIAIGIASSWGMWLNEATAIWIATWIVTFLLLLFGEIIPKSIAVKNAKRVSLLVAPIYKVLMFVLFPIIVFMEMLIKVFSWKNKVDKITEKEIESFIDMWRRSWSLEQSEHEKIKNILEFWDIEVEEIMTPRVKIDRLSDKKTVAEAKEYYLTHTHSRIPVYTRTIDKIEHFVTIRDIINADDDKILADLDLPKVVKVPLNQPIDILLKTFQRTRKHLAIAMDEYGWVSGLITLEDVMEEIFWEIRDETDNEIDDIEKIDDSTLIVESEALIEEVLEQLGLELWDIWLDDKGFDGETIGYVITRELERFPKDEEIIKFFICEKDKCNKIEFKTLTVEDGKLWKIEVKKI